MSKINGTPGRDRLVGGVHHDVINGAEGSDVLFGEDGNDRRSEGEITPLKVYFVIEENYQISSFVAV